MASPRVAVGLVVNPDFGDRIREMAARVPVWVLDTPMNRKAVLALRASGVAGSASVTTFQSAAENPEDACIQILPAIDLHHGKQSQDPPYLAVEVIGARPTEALRQALQGLALTIIAPHEDGFMASRVGSQGK